MSKSSATINSKRFDQILDQCADGILLQKETVETCLAQYPEYAVELEPHLRLVATAVQTCTFTPSSAAKERGRQRLQEALRELEGGARKSSLPPFFKRWSGGLSLAWLWLILVRQPRWAVATAALVLVVVLGGLGTVSASGDALPGETLYPVKRTAEQARLALQPSPTGKAKLHLDYAQRRAQEAGDLVRQGDLQLLDPTVWDLRHNLAAVTRITTQVQDQAAIEGLRSRLDASASQSLGSLQSALQEAPETAQQPATESFQAFSEAYGDAVETVASRSQDRHVAAALGVLQVWAVDPPPPNVEKVLIEVGKIEAHLAAGADSQWTTITLEPQTFDLLHIATVQKFLGEQQIKPGTYTRVRFQINTAEVVASGKQSQAKVPSGSLNLTRPFRVAEGQTTVLLLDFDGAQSVRVTGQGEYIITPKIRVLAREPTEQGEKPDKEKQRKQEKERKSDERKGEKPEKGKQQEHEKKRKRGERD